MSHSTSACNVHVTWQLHHTTVCKVVSCVVQFDTDLATLRRQSAPFYLQWQFWWTTVPIVLTLGLAATAIAMRVTHPNAVSLCSC